MLQRHCFCLVCYFIEQIIIQEGWKYFQSHLVKTEIIHNGGQQDQIDLVFLVFMIEFYQVV